jgi:serine palmitoyltransferase
MVFAIHFQVISRVGDLVGIKYFPAEPPKIAEANHVKLE